MKMTYSFHVNRCVYLLVVSLFATFSTGCSEITDTQLPDGVEGPSTYNNREGAIRLTQATRNELSAAVTGYIVSSGLLTDELGRLLSNGQSVAVADQDRRTGQRIESPPHIVRSLARLARGVVGKYVPGENSAWLAQLFIYEAYAEILTADGWCSGVPLSTLDFEADWTYKPGSTTDEIYTHAIELLDSAYAQAADSVSLQSTISVLKARAQLALGLYGDAMQTVQSIDGSFRYDMRIAFDAGNRMNPQNKYSYFITGAFISDNEGINGLPYRSSNDPRTRTVQLTNYNNKVSWFPVKYVTTSDSSTFVLASGIEAKLILAEGALHDDDPQQMLTLLNALRTTGTYTVDTTQLAGGGEQIDTLWDAGIGGIAGLRPLLLPATPEGQRKLLFSERAAWLFLSGSRQGDLRRLVRKYGMGREEVYPTGAYTISGYAGVYGTDIYFSISADEFRNPLFKGCKYDD